MVAILTDGNELFEEYTREIADESCIQQLNEEAYDCTGGEYWWVIDKS